MLVQLLVPLGVCVALPVLIVWIVFRNLSNSDNKRAEVLIEAIRANNDIDTETLAKAFSKPRKTPREIMQQRLLRGCSFGLSGLVVSLGVALMLILNVIDIEEFCTLLIIGLISFSIGVSNLIVYFVTRKQIPATDDVEDRTDLVNSDSQA